LRHCYAADKKWKENMEEINLGAVFTLRSATMNDLESVTQLIYDVCLKDGDTSVALTVDELRETWEDPKLNLETDAWVVTTKDGRVVGYEEFYNHSQHAALIGDGYVHPDYMGMGIGTTLLRALENRARYEIERADPDVRVFIRNVMSIDDEVAREIHEAQGYVPVRFYWRMEIELNELPQEPKWPLGVALRSFDAETHAQLVYNVYVETFRDHWGFVAPSIEEWKSRFIDSSEYKPELWFIAWDGEEIAGYAVSHYRMGDGWVATLGVRRPWRKRGLGLALLHQTFGAFYMRGTQKISLGVDADSQTGATRLYKRAGMSVGSQYVSYEKELRPGRDIESA
jgi:mycothiol synthase